MSSAEPPAPESARSLDRAWTYTLSGTLLPVAAGLGLALAIADPTDGDGDAMAGLALMAGGLFIGPSLGHVYLGDERRTLIGLGIRGGGIALAVAGFAASRDGDEFFAGVGEFIGLSLVGFAIGTVYSFATLDDSAYEREVAVVPGVGPGGAPALTVSARF